MKQILYDDSLILWLKRRKLTAQATSKFSQDYPALTKPVIGDSDYSIFSLVLNGFLPLIYLAEANI